MFRQNFFSKNKRKERWEFLSSQFLTYYDYGLLVNNSNNNNSHHVMEEARKNKAIKN